MSRYIQNKTKGRKDITIKCLNCNKLFSKKENKYDNIPYKQFLKIKFCCRKCYLEYCHRNAKKVFNKNVFKCSECKKERLVDYKELWVIKKRNATKCFKCSRLKKGHTNRGSFKKGIIPWNKGKGKATYWQRIKTSKRWKDWRTRVFKRDKYTCQKCWKQGGELHPHHIKQKSLFPELIFIVSNGLTLCKDCHKKTDTYGYPKYRLKEKIKNQVI